MTALTITPEQMASIIGNTAKKHNIPLSDLREAFPVRPTTEAEFMAVAEWMQERWVAATAVSIDAPAVRPTSPAPSQGMAFDGIAPKAKPGKRAQAYHYALIEDDGTVKFYRVKAGYKPGFYFVDAQASDDYYTIRNYGTKKAILDRINADRDGALALYGREVGRCGRCNRTLTSEYRKLGIGPVCIDK